jgi:hypothetical protein
MQGESAAESGYHSANAFVEKNEEQMAEATIVALSNLATATAAERGVVTTLTEALIKKETTEKRGQRSLNLSPNKYCCTHGYKVANTHTSLSCNFPKQVHKQEPTRVDNMDGSQVNKE